MAPGLLTRRQPLRIVHLVSSLQVGGMEQFVLRLADEQSRRGHRVTVIGLQGGPLLEQARELGIAAQVLGGAHPLVRAARAAKSLAQLRPQIVHAHNPSALSYALLAKLGRRTRVIMTRHGQGAKRISGLHWRCTDAVVAVSEAAAEAMRERYPNRTDKITVILNGVQITGASQSRDEIRAALGLGGAVVGIIVARIDPLKGHDCLLRALATLRDQGTRATLLVAGDGPEREKIQDLALQLGLTGHEIRFLGFRNDVLDLLSASDFFVLPSHTEGLPLSLLEAMAHRLPVVATPVGGIPEVIRDGHTGLLVPVNEPPALAQAIDRLCRDPAWRRTLGEAAYRDAVEHYSFGTMTERYEELYYRLG